jgi:hypothetical protein
VRREYERRWIFDRAAYLVLEKSSPTLARMSRRRSSSCPLDKDNEDLLEEILLRLSPQPSSLPRASLVCKQWRNILSNPNFIERFRKHHRRKQPPLLGFFVGQSSETEFVFTPVMDRIPSTRLSDSQGWWSDWDFKGCRHGLALLVNERRRKAIVWNPLTGQQHPAVTNLPPSTCDASCWDATVLCADAADGHVHGGDCFSRPFKLVFIWEHDRNMQAYACLYESSSGVWGDVVSTTITEVLFMPRPSVLVGNALCWSIHGGDVLVFDLKMQSLRVIQKPLEVADSWLSQLLRTEDGGLGFAVLSELTIQFWERKSANCDGAVRWVLLKKTIPLEGMLSWSRRSCADQVILFMGYDEDTNVIILTTVVGHFTLQLDSREITHIIPRDKLCLYRFYPYTNFYTTRNTPAI